MRSNLNVLIGILTLLSLLGAVSKTSDAAGQATPTTDGSIGNPPANTHANRTLGYVISWDDSWTVVESQSASDVDRLVLTNGTSSVTFIGRVVEGGMVRCLDDLVSDFADDPTIIRLSPAVDADGNALRGGDSSRAYDVLTYTYTPQNGSTEYAVYLECRSIGTSGATLQIVHAAPLADYNDQIGPRNDLLARVRATPTARAEMSLEIELNDIFFDPQELTIPANTPVTLTLVNKGAAPHTFDVPALNIHTGELASGASVTVSISAPPGTYEFYCDVPGHKEAGMVGVLRVEENGASAGGDQGPPAAGPTVKAVDIAFQPTELAIPANTDVVLSVVNEGIAVHSFDVDALNIHSGELASGTSTTVTINAAPGEYEYYCALPGHKEAGMVGKLIVQ
jgi:uncharacterized cupredoxin-like copper-binding protein